MEYIAHVRRRDKQSQTVQEHLLEVKELAEAYGQKIDVKHIAGLAGLLHDLGKYNVEFTDYLLDAVNNPDAPPKRGSVDHSTAGGKLLFDWYHTTNIDSYKAILAEIVGNAIISHHSYLHDFINPELESDYLRRVRDKELNNFDKTKQLFLKHVMNEYNFRDYIDQAAKELEIFLSKDPSESIEKKFMFLSKFIFSALIDADRTNTRIFEENTKDEQRPSMFNTYYERLLDELNRFEKQQNAISHINHLRRKMSEQCERFAERPSGIYTLSIPTGGGKTLSSLRYALKHAIHYNKKRIVYVVPYTTIIEQNADKVREILDDDANILEHHSNVVEDLIENDEYQDGTMSIQQKLKLAKDNWDSPIIFTTMVQFLNVFYSQSNRNIRRLHNLSESIIIFDEVQKVPVSCVSLFNDSLNFLKTYCHSSIILCTATQPALDYVKNRLEINTDAEMIDNLHQVIESFKRVEIVDKASKDTFDKRKLSDFIVSKINEVPSVLVILNTKAAVKNIYTDLVEKQIGIPIYHLSTSMCAAHRNQVLARVKKHLKANEKVICISTQLIEAGVDISFDCVIRSLAGLDSIAQAAGRCNRHGKKDIQYVYIIDYVEENLANLKEIRVGKNISRRILIDLQRDQTKYSGHILSKGAMDKYYKLFYTEFKSGLDYFIPKLRKNMTELLTAPKQKLSYYQACVHNKKVIPTLFIVNSYKTAAENFKVIDDMTTSIIVPYQEGKDVIVKLDNHLSINDLSSVIRTAQRYTINLYNNELKQLEEKNLIESYFDGTILVLKEEAYNREFGLTLQ